MFKQFIFVWFVAALVVTAHGGEPSRCPTESMQAAARSFQRGEQEAAFSKLDAAIRDTPTSASLFLMRGTLHQNSRDERSAIDDFSRSIELGDQTGFALLGRAASQMTLGDTTAALTDTNICLQLNPKMALAHMLRGRIFHERKDYAAAITELDHAIAIKPTPDAYLYRSLCHLRLKSFASAESDATNAIELSPDDPAPLFARAVALIELGDTDAAVADAGLAKQMKSTARSPNPIVDLHESHL